MDEVCVECLYAPCFVRTSETHGCHKDPKFKDITEAQAKSLMRLRKIKEEALLLMKDILDD